VPSDSINAFPLIVLVDDAEFTASTLNNFIWVTFTIASFVPHIGRKHRHQRWDELNGPKAGV
jgi:4-hydroxy-3-polyprenylbenzoate decarboxylase